MINMKDLIETQQQKTPKEILRKFGFVFANKLTEDRLNFYSEKLEKHSPESIDSALETIAINEKFFPPLGTIFEHLRSSSRSKTARKVFCDKCKDSGSVVLFDEHARSSVFHCNCQRGVDWKSDLEKKGIYVASRINSSGYTEPSTRKTVNMKDSQEQMTKRLDEYWESVLKNQN